MVAIGPIPIAAVRNSAPDAADYGLVVRIVGGSGGVVTQGTVPWVCSDPILEASIDVLLSSRASEATLVALTAMVSAGLDVALSTRASEATLLTVAANTANLDVALSTRASEATLATRASETTLATRLADATFTARVNTLGQKLMAASTPVVIASDQSALPVTGPLTDAELRAVAVPISAAALPLPAGAATDAGLASIFVRQNDGSQHTVVDNFPAVQPVSGPLTDAELRAVAVPISAAALPLPAGAATEATLNAILSSRASETTLSTRASEATLSTRASEATVATLLTDTQLRASPVPVSGPLTDAQLRASAVPVSGPLTDAQLRAVAVPISAAALPLPSGAATEATLATRASENSLSIVRINTNNLDVTLSTRVAEATFTARINTQGQKTMAASTPVVLASDQSAIPVSMSSTGSLANGAETAVAAAAVQIIAANANRKALIIQNTGAASIRVGIAGVTATTGFRLASGDTIILDTPAVVNAVFAIREGASSSTALAQEIA